MRGREPSTTWFRQGTHIEDLTKSKKFCGKLLQKISFIILFFILVLGALKQGCLSKELQGLV